jgi:hypothetical protein
MPREFKTNDYSRLIYKENEMPVNAKRFIREVKSAGYPDIIFDEYSVTTSSEDDGTGVDIQTDLDLSISVDAERYCKNEYPELIDTNYFEALAKVLSIDRYYIFVKFTGKDIKGTKYREIVHSVTFDLKNLRDMEIKIVLKKESYRPASTSMWDMKNDFKEYLASLGYHNIRIFVP